MKTITLLPVRQLAATTVCDHAKIFEVYGQINGKRKMTTKNIKKINGGHGIGHYSLAMICESSRILSFTFLTNEYDFRLESAKIQAEKFDGGFTIIDFR